MDTAKALSRVHSLIRGTLERQHGSPTVVQAFRSEINDSINTLRVQFRHAREAGGTVAIWPKRVTHYMEDGPDGEDPCPVWGPIEDEFGRILGLTVTTENKDGKLGRARVRLEWHKPDGP